MNKRSTVAAYAASVLLMGVLPLSLAACGYTQVQGEMIGQAKKLVQTNNLVCEDYWAFDMSMGVMQGGTGSVSTQDIWMTTYDPKLVDKLRSFAARGAIVQVQYDSRRFAPCNTGFIIRDTKEVQK